MRRVLMPGRFGVVLMAMVLAGGAAYAQVPAQPAPAAPRQTVPVQPAPAVPTQAAPAPRPATPAQPTRATSPAAPRSSLNVRIDIVIFDEGGPQTRRETVTMTTGDGEGASARSNNGSSVGEILLNADVVPTLAGLPPGKVRLRLTLDYWPVFPQEGRDTQRGTRTRVSSGTVLDDGRMMVVSDTTDPANERRVRVEVTATILK